MHRTARLALVFGLVTAFGAAGCSGNFFGPSEPPPPPLPAAPTQPVTAAALPPPTPPPPVVEPEPEPTPAALPPPEQQLAVQRSDLLGGWAIEAGGDRCQLFMVLTGWTGGYRASTRGCSSADLKGISAWDLTGKTIVLKDTAAAPLATLYATAPGRFEGSLASGAAVTVFR